MPEAGDKPHHKGVEDPLGQSNTVTAHGDIDIVTEPAAQGHMPSSPELGNALGNEGIVEVLQEVEAEDATQTDGHIRIAGEVEINLQVVCQGVHPHAANGQLVHAVQGNGQGGQGVGNENLLGGGVGCVRLVQ